MNDDEALDYWAEDELSQPEGYQGIPFSALLPLTAFAISLVLAFFMIHLAGRQLAGPAILGSEGEQLSQPSESSAYQASGGGIAPLFASPVRYWETAILRWAAEWGLDPNLVATVMQIESCGHPEVVSPAGAAGLFQVMPYHFAAGERPGDPETNAARGLAYLKRSLESHGGDTRLGLAGYNTGIAGSNRPESAWPSETTRYVYYGMGIYTDAGIGLGSSGRLDEWLSKGGAGLCSQAAARLGLAP